MAYEKLRRKIACEAARLMWHHKEPEWYQARLKAARSLYRGRIPQEAFPSEREIRDELKASTGSGTQQGRARYPGDPSTAPSGSPEEAAHREPSPGGDRAGEGSKEKAFGGGSGLGDGSVYGDGADSSDDSAYADASGFGDDAPYGNAAAPGNDAGNGDAAGNGMDRFAVFRSLLLPLEMVKQNRHRHPEGDALYHSLQVFELAREALPYDEEFLLAALLHDVGKALDPRDHITAGLSALEGHITPRTAWFIAQHADGAALRQRTLGARAQRRISASEDYEALMLLVDCDRQGRLPGAEVPELEEVFDYLRDLDDACQR
jgi:hypothetical protein